MLWEKVTCTNPLSKEVVASPQASGGFLQAAQTWANAGVVIF